MSGLAGCVMEPRLSLSPNCAAVILAAGDGVRLSSFTHRIFGRHLPKQFCPLVEGETLLEQTLRRTSLLVSLHRTVTVLSCTHDAVLLAAAPWNRIREYPAAFIEPRVC
jgi:mannose-1-phosphate guanylyltransferase